MKWGKTFAGTVALAAIIALSWLVVPTAGAGDKKGDHGMPAVLRLLNEIRVNQALLLQQVSGLELACTTPDLVLLQPRCVRSEDDLTITKVAFPVHNQGGASAGASEALVTFRTSGGPVDRFVPTPLLGGFGGTELVVDIPAGCFNFDIFGDALCKFQIIVDVFIDHVTGSVINPVGMVLESNETNNGLVGQCGVTLF